MARRRVIPPVLDKVLLAQAGKGLPSHEIAAYLLEHHSIKCTPETVRSTLIKITAARAPIARAVIEAQVAKHLNSDAAELDGLIQRAGEIEQIARDAGDLDTAIKAQASKRASLDLRLKLSGLVEGRRAGEASSAPVQINIDLGAGSSASSTDPD